MNKDKPTEGQDIEKTFKIWCKQVKKLGYSPQPKHEQEWLEWFGEGKSPEEARELEEILWATT